MKPRTSLCLSTSPSFFSPSKTKKKSRHMAVSSLASPRRQRPFLTFPGGERRCLSSLEKSGKGGHRAHNLGIQQNTEKKYFMTSGTKMGVFLSALFRLVNILERRNLSRNFQQMTMIVKQLKWPYYRNTRFTSITCPTGKKHFKHREKAAINRSFA